MCCRVKLSMGFLEKYLTESEYESAAFDADIL